MATNDAPSSSPPPREDQPSGAPRPKPWRTEGLPKGKGPAAGWRPSRTAVAWLIAYALLFGLVTMQDRVAKPHAVSYTEFKAQVASGNVSAVFARGSTIEGELKKPAP